jgi:hypothetical protein
MALGNKEHDAALLQTTWQTIFAQYPSIDAAIRARDAGFCKTLRASIRVVDAATKVLSTLGKPSNDTTEAEARGEGVKRNGETPASLSVPPFPTPRVPPATAQPQPQPQSKPSSQSVHKPETHASPTKARRPPLPSILVRGGGTVATPPSYPRSVDERPPPPVAAAAADHKPPEKTTEPPTPDAPVATVETSRTLLSSQAPTVTPPPKPSPAPGEVMSLRSPMPLPRFLPNPPTGPIDGGPPDTR